MDIKDSNKPINLDLKNGFSFGAVIEFQPNMKPHDVVIWHAKSKNSKTSAQLFQSSKDELLIKITDKNGNAFVTDPIAPKAYLRYAIFLSFSVQLGDDEKLYIEIFINNELAIKNSFDGDFKGEMRNVCISIGGDPDNLSLSSSFVLGELLIYSNLTAVKDERIWKYIDEKWAVSQKIRSKPIIKGADRL
ncbi:MAG: hypothetical protein KDI46_10060 [Alphaproteobacteria bacterium]|nr:hypothetical protein [Alphaproteobacteria bacterium]